jgi:hypothetical protein
MRFQIRVDLLQGQVKQKHFPDEPEVVETLPTNNAKSATKKVGGHLGSGLF